MNSEALDLTILLPAFAAGLIVLLTHVPLGQEVLKRGILFIDLAIAQIAGLGVILAHVLHLEAQSAWWVQLVAMSSALAGAFILGQIEKYWGKYQEAIIGITFVLAASISMLLLAGNPNGGDHLKDLLLGQVLWVTWQQLLPVLILSVVILIVWFRFKPQGRGFYLIFALAITSSVQLVGVYLVFASLIIPALGAVAFQESKQIKIAYLIGILGYLLGLILSARWDLPSGALIVCCLAVVALLINCRLFRFHAS